MSLLVGHRDTLSKIPNPIPPVLLLLGPEGVGKSIIARVLAHATGVRDSDYQRVQRLTKPEALAVAEHHATYPLASEVKVSVIDITRATPEALNAMLALLEDPPEYSRFILHSDSDPFLTVKSRCFILNFGLLSTDEVAQVLETKKVPEHVIADAARLSQGRVSVALEHARNYDARQSAMKVLKAVGTADGLELDRALLDALEKRKGEDTPAFADRQEVIASLIATALRNSIADPKNPLNAIPVPVRMDALTTLTGPGRSSLRIRAAALTLIPED